MDVHVVLRAKVMDVWQNLLRGEYIIVTQTHGGDVRVVLVRWVDIFNGCGSAADVFGRGSTAGCFLDAACCIGVVPLAVARGVTTFLTNWTVFETNYTQKSRSDKAISFLKEKFTYRT